MTISGRAVLAVALAALAAPATALAHGGAAGEARALAHDWWTHWSPSYTETVPVVVGAALYALRARRLGSRLPRWRALCFAGGVAVLLLAAASPVDPVGEGGLLWVHMVQHLMLGDLAPLLIVLGLTGPILRPALALGWVQRLRVLSHPAVALPAWALDLYIWHVPALYQGALANDAVHAVEHTCFFVFGALMWSPLIEPLPAPEWFGTGFKLCYVMAVRVAGFVLANVFLWTGTVFYSDYVATAPAFGTTALEDQANAGQLMMAEGGLLTILLLAVLFFRLAREGELRQQLVEQGLDERAVRRAVRYGRGDLMAVQHGVEVHLWEARPTDRPPPGGG